MAFEDYIEQMESTDISLDVKGMHHTGFLFENDDEPVNRQRIWEQYDTEYNVHWLQITSDEPQQITLSAHSYNWGHYHGDCMYSDEQTEIYMKVNDGHKHLVWPGTHHEMAIDIS